MFVTLAQLLLDNSSGGGVIDASAALQALVLIDLVDVAFLDGAGGAFTRASTTTQAILSDNVGHSLHLLKGFALYSLALSTGQR